MLEAQNRLKTDGARVKLSPPDFDLMGSFRRYLCSMNDLQFRKVIRLSLTRL